MKFYKDGYDYVSANGDYEISDYYGWWAVWFKDRKVYLAERLRDAKEWCERHSSGLENENSYVI